VDNDLRDFFGSVDHEKLLTRVAQRVADVDSTVPLSSLQLSRLHCRQLPPSGCSLWALAHDLKRILLYRLLHDRLTEGFEIASGFVPIAHEGRY
jgi:hypothetical protein